MPSAPSPSARDAAREQARAAAQSTSDLVAVVARLVDESRLRVALTEDLLQPRRGAQPAPPAFSP